MNNLFFKKRLQIYNFYINYLQLNFPQLSAIRMKAPKPIIHTKICDQQTGKGKHEVKMIKSWLFEILKYI